MVLDTSEFIDHGCNAWERPSVDLVTTPNRTCHKNLDHRFGLIGGQLGLANGLSLACKACLTAFHLGLLPPEVDLPGHSEPSAKFRRANVLLEEGNCPNPPFFHLCVVALCWHDRTTRRIGRSHPNMRVRILGRRKGPKVVALVK
jgi:hypothetical protein